MLASYWLLSCYTAVEVVFDFSDALIAIPPSVQSESPVVFLDICTPSELSVQQLTIIFR